MEAERERQPDRDQDPPEVAGLRQVEAGALRAWTLSGEQVALELDLAVYSAEAILRAAYKLTDRCYLFLARAERPNAIVAVIAPKVSGTNVQALTGEFANEVLDQRLRESLAREFGPIQTLIAAQAFAEGNLIDPERDDADYRTDPQGARRRR